MKSWTRAIVTLALTLSVSAQAANTPLTIALLFPANDPGLTDGVEVREGALIALEEVKPSFARMGFDLKLQTYDDKRSPEEGKIQAQRILDNPEAIMVIGAINSSVTLTASVVLAPQHMAMLSPKSTNPMVTERGLKNVNRMVPRDDAQAQAAVDFITSDSMGAQSAIVLDDTSTYGKGLFNQFKAAADLKKLKVLSYYSETSNFAQVLADIQKNKPDVIYFAGNADVGVPFLKAIRAAGLELPFMGADGIDNEQFRQGAGQDAVGVFYTGIAAPPSFYSRATAFSAAFKKAYNKEPQVNQMIGYDSLKVATQALQNAFRSNKGARPLRIQVEVALRNVKARGLITGNLSFNSAGDRIGAYMFVLQVDKGLTSSLKKSLDVVLARK